MRKDTETKSEFVLKDIPTKCRINYIFLCSFSASLENRIIYVDAVAKLVSTSCVPTKKLKNKPPA